MRITKDNVLVMSHNAAFTIDEENKTIQYYDKYNHTSIRDLNLDPVYKQLIDAIEGKELKIKPEQALRVIRVMEAAFELAKTGMAINTNI